MAAVVREVLDEIRFVGWSKTSGNRGVHVYCRIEPEWEFPVVRRCALAFARAVERRAPELVTTAWWKEERGERVFVDYNRNARDRTILSASSVRGRPDATVSAPVSWDELPHVETGIDEAVCDLRVLLEWVEREEAAGEGEARRTRSTSRRRRASPPRVQPSRTRRDS